MNLVEEDTYVDLAVTELLRNYPISEEEAYVIAEDFLAYNLTNFFGLDNPVGNARTYAHPLLDDYDRVF